MPGNYSLFKDNSNADLSFFSNRTCYQAKLLYMAFLSKFLEDQFQKESKGSLISKCTFPHLILRWSFPFLSLSIFVHILISKLLARHNSWLKQLRVKYTLAALNGYNALHFTISICDPISQECEWLWRDEINRFHRFY